MNLQFFSKSFIAGVFVSVGAASFLSIGMPFGPLVFCFGLISVILTGSNLFTGKSGFATGRDLLFLIPMLLLNGVGCWSLGLMFDFDVSGIIDKRLTTDALILFGRSVVTGIIMTVSVYYARERRNWLPLIFGIPAFIVSGLPHCVADIFYYCVAGLKASFILPWLISVAGNFVGCNFHRILRIPLP